jgi:hypothetical protein
VLVLCCWQSKTMMSLLNNNKTTNKRRDLCPYSSAPQTKHIRDAPALWLFARVQDCAVQRRSEEEKQWRRPPSAAVLIRHRNCPIVPRLTSLVSRAVYRIAVVVHALVSDPSFARIRRLWAELSWGSPPCPCLSISSSPLSAKSSSTPRHALSLHRSCRKGVYGCCVMCVFPRAAAVFVLCRAVEMEGIAVQGAGHVHAAHRHQQHPLHSHTQDSTKRLGLLCNVTRAATAASLSSIFSSGDGMRRQVAVAVEVENDTTVLQPSACRQHRNCTPMATPGRFARWCGQFRGRGCRGLCW